MEGEASKRGTATERSKWDRKRSRNKRGEHGQREEEGKRDRGGTVSKEATERPNWEGIVIGTERVAWTKRGITGSREE